MEMNAPITFEMSVYAVEEETGNQAIANMSLPRGQYPTPETIRALIKQAEQSFPDGYVLMNKGEFFNAIISEEYGSNTKFATPGSSDFDESYVQEPKG